jgi:glutathione S-transferase
MVLYTCPAGTRGAGAPLIAHPCGVAAKALERAGHDFTVKRVGGFKSIPLSRRGKREEIISLTGQQDVPVLLLDDGSAVHGSDTIVRWAAEHRAAQT